MKASKAVVRPGRKNGGTTLVFRLSRPTVLDVTVMRVYPSCKRFGSFSVRARAGVNRIRFRGRLRGRTLPAGGYRLVVRARGAERDAAAVPIVIARGKTTSAALRKARTTVVCSEPVAVLGAMAAPPGSLPGSDDQSSVGAVLRAVKDRVTAPVVGAAGAVARTTRGISARLGAATGKPYVGPVILTLVGFFLLASAALGAVVLAHLARLAGFRVRRLT